MSFGTWLFTGFVTLVVIRLLGVAEAGASVAATRWPPTPPTRGRSPPYAVLLAIITALAWLAGNRAAAGFEALAHGRASSGFSRVLAVFKYSRNARSRTWEVLVGRARRVACPLRRCPTIVAPLGLSFITFGIIHYFVAVYRGAAPENLRDFFLYVSFFPTVTLGPIKLYEPFDSRPQCAAPSESGDEVAYAIWRITAGLAKKLVLAETIVAAR